MKLHHATAKKYARNLIAALVAVAAHHVANGTEYVEQAEAAEEHSSAMSNTLQKYRPDYVKTTSYSGSASLDNGDDVAALLRGLSPDETCAVADAAFNLPEFSHWERWQHLNPGSRRMNAGNRIRAAVRRGDLTVEQLAELVGAKDLVEEDADEQPEE